MKYTDQKEFLYDPVLFCSSDTQLALRIHDEYVRKGSARPYPKFLEVDRVNVDIDPVFHAPRAPRTQISRELEIPTLVTFEKPRWTMGRVGLTPTKKYRFWMSNLQLKQFNYFPARGDYVAYNGYRLFVTHAAPEPEAYWQQTNVWLGISVEAQIAPEGDASPVQNTVQVVPAEVSPAPPVPFKQAPNALPLPNLM